MKTPLRATNPLYSVGMVIARLALLYGCFGSLAGICDQPNAGAVLIPLHAQWRYQKGLAAPEPAWRQPQFDDSHWQRGAAGFGYGDGDDRTVLDSMRGHYASLRIRHRFDNPASIETDTWYLYVRYDDAFIAFLNGQEVARSGIERSNGNFRIASHEASRFERFPITGVSRYLRKGSNTLAIEGFNRGIGSSDFSLHPVLAARILQNQALEPPLTQEQMLADLHYLEQRLEDQASYYLKQADIHRRSLQRLNSQSVQRSNTLDFARRLQKFIAQIGDAHAEVDYNLDGANDRYLPIRLAESRHGIIALDPQQDTFYDEQHPILTAIDGKPLAVWLEVAARFIARASPQFVREASLRELRSIDRMRAEMAMPMSSSVELTLQSLDGKKSLLRRPATVADRLHRVRVVKHDSRILKGNIGYLRIPAMRDSEIADIVSAMADFQETGGLIIDVRDNRGGSYGLLHALYGYFMAAGSSPYVTNIAAYRLSSRFNSDHLHYRPTYPLRHRIWTSTERNAIVGLMAGFKPEWNLPDGRFSDWHFMVLDRSGDPAQYQYDQPVAVLANAASFSATDGFLSAFADLPGVVLVGQDSGGGSGTARSIRLPHSGIEIWLSSMASFRPNGRLFDGNGIPVDIPVAPMPGDFIGRSDHALQRALAWIKAHN